MVLVRDTCQIFNQQLVHLHTTPRLVNSVETTENSVLKVSVNHWNYWNFQISILTIERWEQHPKLYLNYNFCTISRKINLNLGKRGGLGGWRVRCRKFPGKLSKIVQKIPRNFRKMDRIYWNLVKLLKFWNPTEIIPSNWSYWNWNYQPSTTHKNIYHWGHGNKVHATYILNPNIVMNPLSHCSNVSLGSWNQIFTPVPTIFVTCGLLQHSVSFPQCFAKFTKLLTFEVVRLVISRCGRHVDNGGRCQQNCRPGRDFNISPRWSCVSAPPPLCTSLCMWHM